jgi:hypothetical protein
MASSRVSSASYESALRAASYGGEVAGGELRVVGGVHAVELRFLVIVQRVVTVPARPVTRHPRSIQAGGRCEGAGRRGVGAGEHRSSGSHGTRDELRAPPVPLEGGLRRQAHRRGVVEGGPVRNGGGGGGGGVGGGGQRGGGGGGVDRVGVGAQVIRERRDQKDVVCRSRAAAARARRPSLQRHGLPPAHCAAPAALAHQCCCRRPTAAAATAAAHDAGRQRAPHDARRHRGVRAALVQPP